MDNGFTPTEQVSLLSPRASRLAVRTSDVDQWEAALAAFLHIPAECQTLRMAFLLGQLECCTAPFPSAFPHHDFWYAEAMALPAADPALRHRVIDQLETVLSSP